MCRCVCVCVKNVTRIYFFMFAIRFLVVKEDSENGSLFAQIIAAEVAFRVYSLATLFLFLYHFFNLARAKTYDRHDVCQYVQTFNLIFVFCIFVNIEACSSRSTPKPRPPTSTDRPNITFHMYTCPPDYAEWYCLNGATCFTVKIVDSLLYNCL